MTELALYEDKSMTKPVTDIDFGRPSVGSKNMKTLYLVNLSRDWPISDIRLNLQDVDLKITCPQFLAPGEMKTMTVEWNPSLKRRVPLDITELIQGELLIG